MTPPQKEQAVTGGGLWAVAWTQCIFCRAVTAGFSVAHRSVKSCPNKNGITHVKPLAVTVTIKQESWEGYHARVLMMGGQKEEGPWGLLTSRSSQSVSFRFRERPPMRNQGAGWRDDSAVRGTDCLRTRAWFPAHVCWLTTPSPLDEVPSQCLKPKAECT